MEFDGSALVIDEGRIDRANEVADRLWIESLTPFVERKNFAAQFGVLT